MDLNDAEIVTSEPKRILSGKRAGETKLAVDAETVDESQKLKGLVDPQVWKDLAQKLFDNMLTLPWRKSEPLIDLTEALNLLRQSAQATQQSIATTTKRIYQVRKRRANSAKDVL
jgi:hypothetical protein